MYECYFEAQVILLSSYFELFRTLYLVISMEKEMKDRKQTEHSLVDILDVKSNWEGKGNYALHTPKYNRKINSIITPQQSISG